MDFSFLYSLAKASITLLIVIDPFGTVPVIIGITKEMDERERMRTFNLAFYVSAALLTVFAILGQTILLFFGISVHSFMIAGGILVLLVSLDIIFSEEGMLRITNRSDLGAVPLAFPLLVGPGAITTTIVAIQSSGLPIALASIAIVMAVTYVTLRGSFRIYALLGRTGSLVVAKVVGVFITAIGIQFILSGIQYYYPPGTGTP
jgi:multiple antibiotic resistance protein